MTVGHILETKGGDVFTLRPEATLEEAAKVLAEHRIGAIVLMDESDHVAGIVSERDIVRLVAKAGAESLTHPVRDVMTLKVATCSRETSIDEVLAIMTHGRFRHLPVVEDGKLLGIVSIGDVVKKRIEDAEREAEQMREYIAAG
ncbi:CBS domain-containing protein [Jiella marina]|uniref:CBS domain-containing protein n=1 Tax=Jiella sp. LLJ827 TaxID=2917712 RepID=UPI0021006B96|nr:CBS domain-containing protein [Jiella sp. LLJ827]MCQ0989089.1 CBS domain-containing protein [Jiella sp. LLJ827]